MPIVLSYIGVVLIWSTTPMAIVLSNDSLSPHASIMLRMCIALVLLTLIALVWKKSSVLNKANWRIYVAAGLGIFPNMSLVYVAANYIPSGMIALIFAFNPIATGVFSILVLREKFLSTRRVIAIALSLIGLAVIFSEQMQLDENSSLGILLIIASTMFFAFSQVLIKFFQRHENVPAFEQTLGSLCFAVPGLIVCWLFVEGFNVDWEDLALSQTSLMAVLYLSIIGTVIGFMTYFFVLSQISVALVSLIPLITPVLALWLGAVVLDEPLTDKIVLGTVFMLLGLLLYGDLFKLAKNRLNRLIRA